MSGQTSSTDAALSEMMAQYHAAAADFIKGDPEPYKRLFSQRDDVTLGNPFGPVARGWREVSQIMDRAAALYEEGTITSFKNVSTYVTPELAYVVEVERFVVKLAGGGQVTPVALRTTSIFRPEDGVWKILHRHADPITSARSPESVIQR